MKQFLSAILVAFSDQFKTDRGLSFASKLFLAVKIWYQCLLPSPLTAWPYLTSRHDHQFPIHTHESGMSHGSQAHACLWIFIDFSPAICSLIPFCLIFSCDVLFGSFFFCLTDCVDDYYILLKTATDVIGPHFMLHPFPSLAVHDLSPVDLCRWTPPEI